MIQTAIRTDARPIIENKGKFMLVHSSTGHKYVSPLIPLSNQNSECALLLNFSCFLGTV